MSFSLFFEGGKLKFPNMLNPLEVYYIIIDFKVWPWKKPKHVSGKGELLLLWMWKVMHWFGGREICFILCIYNTYIKHYMHMYLICIYTCIYFSHFSQLGTKEKYFVPLRLLLLDQSVYSVSEQLSGCWLCGTVLLVPYLVEQRAVSCEDNFFRHFSCIPEVIAEHEMPKVTPCHVVGKHASFPFRMGPYL